MMQNANIAIDNIALLHRGTESDLINLPLQCGKLRRRNMHLREQRSSIQSCAIIDDKVVAKDLKLLRKDIFALN